MKNLFLPAALVLMSTAAIAQSTPYPVKTTTPAPIGTATAGTIDDCVSRTTPENWTSLGLSAEQLSKVREIQASHRKECAAHDETKAHETKANETKMTENQTADAKAKMMDKHEGKIKEVLTAEQYGKWLTWCAEQPAKSEVKQKM